MNKPIWRRAAYSSARGVAIAAAVTGLAVTALLLADLVRRPGADPLQVGAIERLHKRLAANPDDADLKEQIRDFDLLSRKAHFSGIAFRKNAALLLLAAVLAGVASLRLMSAMRGAIPAPSRFQDVEEPGDAARNAAISIASAGAATALAAVALHFAASGPAAGIAPRAEPGASGTHAAVPPALPGLKIYEPLAVREKAPATAEIRANWPGFRGPMGKASAQPGEWPAAWDARTGENVDWKTRVPLSGFSSPVVWGDRVFLTGADSSARAVMCFDAKTGALAWRFVVRDVPGSPSELPRVSEDTGFAAPTAAADGRYVFSIFATGDVVCLTPSGKGVWGRNLGVPSNPYGHASSLAIHGDVLLVQYDTEKSGRLFGLDAHTGAVVFDVARDVQPSWASPVLAEIGGAWQVILVAAPFVSGHDAATGRLIWKSESMSGEVGPSAAYGSGLVFAVNSGASLVAVRPGTSEIAWEAFDYLPDVSSPLATAGLLFVANSEGSVRCFDAVDGGLIWEKEFDSGFYSSAVEAGGNVYLTDFKGVTRIFAAGREYAGIGTGVAGESVVTTPAFAGGKIFIRAEKTLFCVALK